MRPQAMECGKITRSLYSEVCLAGLASCKMYSEKYLCIQKNIYILYIYNIDNIYYYITCMYIIHIMYKNYIIFITVLYTCIHTYIRVHIYTHIYRYTYTTQTHTHTHTQYNRCIHNAMLSYIYI